MRKLQECLHLKPESEMRGSILDNLGYCFLKLGWFEEAAITFSENLRIFPSDNGGRFFLASAYASLKWIEEAVKELKIILEYDPTDVLARHDLALRYRDKGWLKESLPHLPGYPKCRMKNHRCLQISELQICGYPGRRGECRA